MSNKPKNPVSPWRRFGNGMLVSLLIVAAWSVICWYLRDYSGPCQMELNALGIMPLYVLAMLAYMVVCLLLARRKTLWWSSGAVAGTLLGAAGPITLALIAASGMPAMRY
ncbi:hypothetical protein [Janthinobacterium sp. RB2R34]|uniref:hypothetical protein n=1 Tax=Janthinobacterium sp. RB2R34 TaxID=3424193 RepID=UPI003F24BF47